MENYYITWPRLHATPILQALATQTRVKKILLSIECKKKKFSIEYNGVASLMRMSTKGNSENIFLAHSRYLTASVSAVRRVSSFYQSFLTSLPQEILRKPRWRSNSRGDRRERIFTAVSCHDRG